MKNLRKGENGITLIALVVTIVVLLILAGVTINAVFGNGGVIERGHEAIFKSEVSSYKDALETEMLGESIGNEEFSKSSINAQTTSDIQKYIPNFDKKYENVLEIFEGGLCAGIEAKDKELGWLNDLGIYSAPSATINIGSFDNIIETYEIKSGQTIAQAINEINDMKSNKENKLTCNTYTVSDADNSYYLIDSNNRVLNTSEEVKSREIYNLYWTPINSNDGRYSKYIYDNKYLVTYVHLKKGTKYFPTSGYNSFVAILPEDAIIEDVTKWGAEECFLFAYGMSTIELYIKGDINGITGIYDDIKIGATERTEKNYQFVGVSRNANPTSTSDLCALTDKVSNGETYYCDLLATYDISKYSYEEAVEDFKTTYPQFLGENKELEYYSYKINYYKVDNGSATLNHSTSINSNPTLKKTITTTVERGLSSSAFTTKFIGWNTKIDGTGETYMPGDEIKLEGLSPTIDLYTMWREEPARKDQVTFNSVDEEAGIINTNSEILKISYSGSTNGVWTSEANYSSLKGSIKNQEDCSTNTNNSTLTISNTSSYSIQITINYNVDQNGGTVKIDDISLTSGTNTYNKVFKPGEKIDIYIQSASATDATTVTITDMYIEALS